MIYRPLHRHILLLNSYLSILKSFEVYGAPNNTVLSTFLLSSGIEWTALGNWAAIVPFRETENHPKGTRPNWNFNAFLPPNKKYVCLEKIKSPGTTEFVEILISNIIIAACN